MVKRTLTESYHLINSILPVEKLTIITHDDSETSKKIVTQFKQAGINGFWRPIKRGVSKAGKARQEKAKNKTDLYS